MFYNNLDSFFWIFIFDSFNVNYVNNLYYLNLFLKYNINFGLYGMKYIICDNYMLTNNIVKMRYNGRLFLGIYYGRSKLNKFYKSRHLISYNKLFLNSLRSNLKNSIRLCNFHKFKTYLRKPLLF